MNAFGELSVLAESEMKDMTTDQTHAEKLLKVCARFARVFGCSCEVVAHLLVTAVPGSMWSIGDVHCTVAPTDSCAAASAVALAASWLHTCTCPSHHARYCSLVEETTPNTDSHHLNHQNQRSAGSSACGLSTRGKLSKFPELPPNFRHG